MSQVGDEHWIIESRSTDGQRFRPNDWIERISASLGSFGSDHRLHYHEEVQPCVIQGQKCLLVSKRLSQDNPLAMEYIMHFAEQNHLRIQEDRREEELAVAEARRETDPGAATA